jgi:hypothetical protein
MMLGVNESRRAEYHGFTLTVSRNHVDKDGSRWWLVRVDGIADLIQRPWITQTEAELHAASLVRDELTKRGEEPPTDEPDWKLADHSGG